MSKLLFRMRNVPEDEADDVRRLLEDNDIDYYETHAGRWQISFPGIWVVNDKQFEQARTLLDEYQQRRSAAKRAEYEEMRLRGEAKSMLDVFMEQPVRFLAYMLGIALVLYFSLQFFLQFL
ncbi:MAG: DUF6164 family protein [Gammaproteobacteria bacterium]